MRGHVCGEVHARRAKGLSRKAGWAERKKRERKKEGRLARLRLFASLLWKPEEILETADCANRILVPVTAKATHIYTTNFTSTKTSATGYSGREGGVARVTGGFYYSSGEPRGETGRAIHESIRW